MVMLPKCTRRRVNGEGGSEAEESEVEAVEEGIIVVTSIPWKPKGMVVVEEAPVGARSIGISRRGVVNPKFLMFFNPSQRFARDHENWPAWRCGRSG